MCLLHSASILKKSDVIACAKHAGPFMELNGISSISENAKKKSFLILFELNGIICHWPLPINDKKFHLRYIWDFLELPQNSNKVRVPPVIYKI